MFNLCSMAEVPKVQGLNKLMEKLTLKAESLKKCIEKDEKIIEEKKVELQTLNINNNKRYNFTLRSDVRRNKIIDETKMTIDNAKKNRLKQKRNLNKIKKEMKLCEKDASKVNAIVAKYPEMID